MTALLSLRRAPLRRVAPIGLGLAIAVSGIAVGVAAAAFGSGNTIMACVKDNGEVRLIDPSSTKKDLQACKKDETAVNWNVVGPTGPMGAKGNTGATGATGATGP